MTDLLGAAMKVGHDATPEDPYTEIEVVGDGPYIKATDLEDIINGKADSFRKSGDALKDFNGLSPAMKRKISRRIKKYAADGEGGAKSKSKIDKYVSGYSMFDVVQPEYNMDYLAKLYEISAPHKAAVDAKVTNIVGLGYEWRESLKTQEKLSNLEGNEESLERLRRKISRARAMMDDWVETVNNEDVFIETLRKVMVDLETTGNGYIEIGRKKNGQIGYIGHLHSTTMRRRVQKDGYIQLVGQHATFFRNFGDLKTTNPVGDDSNPNEVIHIMKYTPSNSYYGVPDVLSARNAVAGDEFAARFNLDYFEHKAVPRYIVTLKGASLSAASEQKIVDFLSSSLKGQHHRTLYIPLPGDSGERKVEFKMEPVEAKIQDASFSKYNEHNRNVILMSHRVPLTQTGFISNVSLGASRDSARFFKEQVARPAQDILEAKLRPVFREVTDVFDFHLEEMTLTDADTLSKIHERYLRWEVLTPNNVLEELGKKGRKGGDKTVGVMAQAKARSSKARETQAQSNQSRTRDQERSGGPDKDSQSNETRNPKGDGSNE